jgi:hypothetical protein
MFLGSPCRPLMNGVSVWTEPRGRDPPGAEVDLAAALVEPERHWNRQGPPALSAALSKLTV